MGVKRLLAFTVLAVVAMAPIVAMDATISASGSATTVCGAYPLSQCPPPSVTEPTTPATTAGPPVSTSVGTAAAQGSGGLAFTGADISILVALAAVVIVVGFLLIRVARRRA